MKKIMCGISGAILVPVVAYGSLCLFVKFIDYLAPVMLGLSVLMGMAGGWGLGVDIYKKKLGGK